jgi:hypothetical protein
MPDEQKDAEPKPAPPARGPVPLPDPPPPTWWDTLKPYAEIAGLIALFIYTGYTIKMYGANRKAAEAAQSAADTAHASLILANRPWIKIKHRIISPLTFDFVGAAGPAATMTVEDTIENVGNGIALNVVSWEDVIPVDPDLSTATARKRQEQWCDANKAYDSKSPTELNGNVLFPRDPFVQISHTGPLMSTVKQAVANNMSNMGNLFKGKGPNPLIGKVGFVMVGCVVYRSSLDRDGTRPDVTGFMYYLAESKDGLMYPWVTPTGTADKLQLFALPTGFFAY